jgi:hypothetical protein
MMHHLGDCVLCLVIVLGPLPLCLSLTLLTQNGKGRTGFTHGWLTLLTAWCILETCLGVLLGILRHLTLGAVLTSELLLFVWGVIVWLALRRRAPWRSGFGWLTWAQPLNNLETLLVGAIAFVGVALLWRTWTRPITDYDSLSFHLPAMAKWYQTGSLAMPEQFYDPARYAIQSTYPYNWEVLCALFLMPFREDVFVAAPNLIAWLMLGLAVYGLSLDVGATRLQSMAAAALVMTLPAVVKNVNTLHIDLQFAAFFLAGVYFAVAYHRARSFACLALFIATLGMILGIKMSGPVYAVLLVALHGGLRLIHRGSACPTPSSRAVVPLIVIGLACCLLVGSFWYARNYAALGNPLGYVRVQLAGRTIFPGVLDAADIRRTTLSSVFQLTNLAHWKILIGQIKDQLHVPFFAMVALWLSLPYAVLVKHRRLEKEYLLWVALLFIGTGWLYWQTPGSGVPAPDVTELTSWMGQGFRYGFPCLALLGVMAAAGARAWQIWDEGLVATVLVSSLLSISDVAESNLLYLGILALLAGAQLKATPQSRVVAHLPKALRLSGSVALCAVLLFGVTFVARKRRESKRHEVYGGIVQYLTKQVGQDETIGYLASHRSYLFYGKELNRKVEYVPATTDDMAQWLETLRRRGVSVIAVGPGPQPESWKSIAAMQAALASHPSHRRVFKELVWLEDPNGPFVRVFGENPGAEPLLYRFRSPALGSPEK